MVAKLKSGRLVLLALALALVAGAILFGFAKQGVTAEQAQVIAKEFLLRAGLVGFTPGQGRPIRAHGRIAAYHFDCHKGPVIGMLAVDVETERVYHWGDAGGLTTAEEQSSSLPGRFAGESSARKFALALGQTLYKNRSLIVDSFKRKGGMWHLTTHEDVVRDGYPFVDREFGFSIVVASADGALLDYGEEYAIPEVESPPASPITLARAYRVATGHELPSGQTLEAKLGFAQPQNLTGRAMLCWRITFRQGGRLVGKTYVDARRGTVLKRSVYK